MKFFKINPTLRIAFGLVSLTTSMILLAAFVGIFPDRRSDIVRSRGQLCESLAMSFSAMAHHADVQSIQQHFESVLTRNEDIKTLGLRRSNGDQVLQIGDHFSSWSLKDVSKSTDNEICIPVYGNDELWGSVEVRFEPIEVGGALGVFYRPEFILAGFMSIVGIIVFFFYLRFVLRHLNPSKVIPNRVREALDSLAEGLLILDKQERIVLANQAFQTATGKSMDDLVGKTPSSLQFTARDEDLLTDNANCPWQTTLNSGSKVQGRLLAMNDENTENKTTFSVSCAPILDDKGNNRGAMASFENVTLLEDQKNRLSGMLQQLGDSTAEIKKQNRELELLATRDPLTGCLNRRSFFQMFGDEFSITLQGNGKLSAFMVDIDHFKSINDNHGHAVGDTVLQQVATTLENNVREKDLVCRYGGEEFAILLPGTGIDQAADIAERIRGGLEALKFSGLSVTASLGVSALCQSPSSPQDLLEQADKCLYVAKRNGRNQVVRWDNVPDDVDLRESDPSSADEGEKESSRKIPFHAVTALISALAYRDHDTAIHSRRVADLCVAVAEGLLPMKDCYVLEIAGLLHDIGKMGLPDSILLKPSTLTEEEWQIMRLNQRLGDELIRNSFGCEELDRIVENYRKPFSSDRRTPIGARILAIADAYDSMTRDQHYRASMTRKEAIAELRRCAGDQFDPELVEQFVETIKVRGNEFSVCDVSLSKAAALNIGLQIERLSDVLDKRDAVGISAIAKRLEETAIKFGATAIAEKAHTISTVTKHDGELYEIIRCTNELLDLCRSSQHSFLSAETESKPVPV